jgi:NAD(P)-dependent dehydrogenase (short-subunit alcohol dehydrogenase family)
VSAQGRLAGKAAIVTGGGTGIGRAIATALGREGAHVVIGSRRVDVGEQAAAELRAEAIDALFIPTDIAIPEQGRRLVAEAVRRYGRLDILVNNAGISTSFAPFLEITELDYDQVVGTNLRGTFFLSQAAAREMIRTGGGKIVIVGSNLAEIAQAGCAHYMATKGGLRSLTRSLALELAPHGIQVNAVAPGEIFVEAARDFFEDPANRSRFSQIPAGRIGRAEEVAGAVVMLASVDSSYITGQMLVIDGGQSIV